MKVIDVSDWQLGLNLAQAKAEGVDGVIVKLGQNFMETETARQFIFDGLNAGLKVGVYYYSTATNYAEARAEGKWVNAKLEEIGLVDYHLQLGVWFDYEESDVINGFTVQENTNMICEFINQIKAVSRVGVYGGYCALWDNTYLISQLPWVKAWVAQYNTTCDYPKEYMAGWQFTDHYPCAGFEVDCSEWYD